MCDGFDFEDEELTEDLIVLFNKWEEDLKIIDDTKYIKKNKINMFIRIVEDILIEKLL